MAWIIIVHIRFEKSRLYNFCQSPFPRNNLVFNFNLFTYMTSIKYIIDSFQAFAAYHYHYLQQIKIFKIDTRGALKEKKIDVFDNSEINFDQRDVMDTIRLFTRFSLKKALIAIQNRKLKDYETLTQQKIRFQHFVKLWENKIIEYDIR